MSANEPAYPSANTQYFGLTKRELFAAMVMQGFAADPNGGETSIERIADYSVRWADALLAKLAEVKS